MKEKQWLYFALGVTTVINMGAVSNQLAPRDPVLALNEQGITFPDGTVQTTAATAPFGPPGVGLRPAVALRPERALLSAASVPEDINAAFADAEPLSLAAGDFDGDGMPDLAAGYAIRNGGLGLVALWRGNVDAVYGWTDEARRRRAEGTFTDAPFLGPPALFVVSEPPDFLAAGDFDGDSNWDLAGGARNGEAIYLLSGDGKGGLGAAEAIALSGRIGAWAAGEVNRRDGLEDLVVALDGENGPHLLVFEGPNGALRWEPENIPLAAPAEDIALGSLDDDPFVDIAVAVGSEISIVRGRDRRLSWSRARHEAIRAPERRTQVLSFAPLSLAIGDFVFEEDYRLEIAAVDAGGGVHLLARRTARARRALKERGLIHGGVAKLGSVSDHEAAGTDWVAVESFSGSANEALVDRRPQLVATRTLVQRTEQLLVLDVASGMQLLSVPPPGPFWPQAESLSMRILEDTGPVASVSLRLNSDALDDVVLLENGSADPVVIATAFDRTFTVDSLGDESDWADDGFCDTDSSDDDGPCTLRAAIEQANNLLGSTQIAFNVDPGGFLPAKIELGSALPALGAGITIDASTQAKVVAIDGNGAFAAPGIELSSSSSNDVVRDLYVWGMGDNGIQVGGNSNIVEGCRVGKTSDFLLVGGVGNLQGIEVTGIDNLVGGLVAGSENVVSGNGTLGISVTGAVLNAIKGNYIGTNTQGTALPTSASVQPFGLKIGAVEVTIEGNVISGNDIGVFLENSPSSTIVKGNKVGTDLSGASALGNRVGVSVSGGETKVGGSTVADRNVISGNSEAGLEISGTAGGPFIEGNYIGTNATGDGAVANGRGVDVTGSVALFFSDNLISGNSTHGVFVHSHQPASDSTFFERNLIGTDAAGALGLANGGYGIWIADFSTDIEIGSIVASSKNSIGFNSTGGIGVGSGSSGVSIKGNEFIANERLGIDLVAAMFLWDGVTMNDLLDADAGPNGLQNFPVITSVTTSVSQVSWQLHSTPSTSFEVHFFSSASCDPSGFGEGEAYLGTKSGSTDANGDLSESGSNLSELIPSEHYVTAVATNTTTGSSSEFSMCRREHATCPYPPNLVLTDAQVAGPQSFTACQTITTDGAFGVGAFSSAVFTAGESVTFGSGFEVFGDLTVAIDPTLATP